MRSKVQEVAVARPDAEAVVDAQPREEDRRQEVLRVRAPLVRDAHVGVDGAEALARL